jgi:hypothetical protein
MEAQALGWKKNDDMAGTPSQSILGTANASADVARTQGQKE